ncbi:hypothetical protein CLV76_10961 [Marivita geojedonensis]|nr:hypothetical protein CLV76_10961 [Marivita geojedonensis]
MMRKSAFHLICAKYVIALLHGNPYSPLHTSFPLCVRRMGHSFAAYSPSSALRVCRCAKISSCTKSRKAAMRLDWRNSSG